MAIIRICAAFSLGALGAPESEIVGAELTHGERFVCDGAALSGDHSGRYTFWGTVRQMPSASAYTCVYTRAGIATTLIIPVLARPTIQAPAAQATIARTTDLPLSFTPGQAGPTQVALNHMQALTVAAGTTRAIIPAATLARAPAGPGLLIVTQTAKNTPSRSVFHRAQAIVVVAAYAPVIFQ